MHTYVIIYTGSPSPDEDRAAVTAAWKQWFQTLGTAVVDSGSIFTVGKTVTAGGSVQDGTELKLTGYSVLQAESLAVATELVKQCPGLSNADIAVYETVPFN